LTYRKLADGSGELLRYDGPRMVEKRKLGSIYAHNFILGVDFQADGSVWVASEGGVSRGRTAIASESGMPSLSAVGNHTAARKESNRPGR